MIKVVYFNNWEESLAFTAKDLKKKYGNDIRIIVSSENKYETGEKHIDEFIVEDWKKVPDNIEKSMQNYTKFLLDTIKRYHVDIFIVKKYYKYIAQHRDELSSLNTFMVLEDYKCIKLCENKADTYKYIRKTRDKELIKTIPDYINSSNIKNILSFIESKQKSNTDICMKFNESTDGKSFRKITDNQITMESLYNHRIDEANTYEVCKMLLADTSNCNKLLFMDILESPEINVDCYNSKNGFIAVCKKDVMNGIEKLFYNSDISDICMKIGSKLELRFAYNVKFMLDKNSNDIISANNIRLLGVNTNIAAGVNSNTACNMNVEEIMLLDILNRESEYTIDKFIDFEDLYIMHNDVPTKLINSNMNNMI